MLAAILRDYNEAHEGFGIKQVREASSLRVFQLDAVERAARSFRSLAKRQEQASGMFYSEVSPVTEKLVLLTHKGLIGVYHRSIQHQG